MKRLGYVAWAILSGIFFAMGIRAEPTAEAKPPPHLPSVEEIAANRPTNPPSTPPPSEIPDSAPLMEHLKLLSEFLELSPKKLENIRRTIAVIESMDEAERVRLRENLKRIQVDLEKTEDKIGDLAAELTPPEAKTFKRYWLSLPSEERESIEVELVGLGKREKTNALRQHIAAFSKQEERLLEAFRSKPGPAAD